MKKKLTLTLSILGLGVVLAQSAGAAGDPQAGRTKAETCMGCHAVSSYNNVYPTYHVPKLGGQNADYIVAALQGYRDGSRGHQTMHANAVDLSDADMADIAAFFASSAAQ